MSTACHAENGAHVEELRPSQDEPPHEFNMSDQRAICSNDCFFPRTCYQQQQSRVPPTPCRSCNSESQARQFHRPAPASPPATSWKSRIDDYTPMPKRKHTGRTITSTAIRKSLLIRGRGHGPEGNLSRASACLAGTVLGLLGSALFSQADTL